MRFSQVDNSDGLNNPLLPQGFLIEQAPHVGTGVEHTLQGQGPGAMEVSSLKLPQFSSQVNWRSCPLDDLLHQPSRYFSP